MNVGGYSGSPCRCTPPDSDLGPGDHGWVVLAEMKNSGCVSGQGVVSLHPHEVRSDTEL